MERLAAVDRDASPTPGVARSAASLGLQQGDVVDGAVGRDLEVLAVADRARPRRCSGRRRRPSPGGPPGGRRTARRTTWPRRAPVRPAPRRCACRAEAPGNTSRRASPESGQHVAGSSPDSVYPVTSCETAPLVGAHPVGVGDHQGAGGADRVEQLVGPGASRCSGSTSSPSISPTAARSTRPSPLPDTRARRRRRARPAPGRAPAPARPGRPAEHRRVRQRLLVDHRDVGRLTDRVAVRHRVAEAARRIGGGRGEERAR